MDVIGDILTCMPVDICAARMYTLQGHKSAHLFDGSDYSIHLVNSGTVSATYKKETIKLNQGDMILFPKGASHIVFSNTRFHGPVLQENEPATEKLGASCIANGKGVRIAEMSSKPSVTCIRFRFRKSARTLPEALFPDYIVNSLDQDQAMEWLVPLMWQLVEEAHSSSTGATAAFDGLLKLVLSRFLKTWIGTASDETLGWLRTLRCPHIGSAIELIHQHPARDWSVAALAREVGMSRSNFAMKFAQMSGASPQKYLTRWRMISAANKLETELSRTIRDIANSVGYESEASFSVAFKRQFGQSPSCWRKGFVTRPTSDPISFDTETAGQNAVPTCRPQRRNGARHAIAR